MRRARPHHCVHHQGRCAVCLEPPAIRGTARGTPGTAPDRTPSHQKQAGVRYHTASGAVSQHAAGAPPCRCKPPAAERICSKDRRPRAAAPGSPPAVPQAQHPCSSGVGQLPPTCSCRSARTTAAGDVGLAPQSSGQIRSSCSRRPLLWHARSCKPVHRAVVPAFTTTKDVLKWRAHATGQRRAHACCIADAIRCGLVQPASRPAGPLGTAPAQTCPPTPSARLRAPKGRLQAHGFHRECGRWAL